ncbi:hypothetical protein ACFY00_10375 [Kitasatospora sp. NPDC001540]|uniref:hypothetical protein n=1 Tax=Kitasatospora sp. NPDC001540 TaxID=3364014 RepID=UPI0036AD6613
MGTVSVGGGFVDVFVDVRAGGGAMAGGSWWREGGSADGADGGESVYLPRQSVDSPPPKPPAPPAPPKPPEAPAVGPDRPRPPAMSSPAEVERAFAYSEDPDGPGLGAVQPGWTVTYDDLPEPEPASAPELAPEPDPDPEPEAEAAPEPAAAPGRERRGLGRTVLAVLFGTPKTAPGPAPTPPPAPAAGGARKPAPLLLLGAALLLGGAATGTLLAMLLGWAAAYLSQGWTDLMKKFAVLGIPLITVTGLTVWNWGREKGRWGSQLSPGTDVGAMTWASAPGVLRVAAVLSALFVLAVTLRRRKG